MEPIFFPTPAKWRAWLKKHHASKAELLVGFYKRDSGKPSITWPESVDQALCFGWIDGVRRRVDAVAYTIRFTPRKVTSTWSAINVRRVAELEAEGLVHEAGRKVFVARHKSQAQGYSIKNDRKDVKLSPADARVFKANKKAWAWYQQQPPWYQRQAAWYIASAKQAATRARRLARIIDDNARQRTVKEMGWG